MAKNNEEQIIIKVKAELAGFTKSMEAIKKQAQKATKDIEKATKIDFSKGSKESLNKLDKESKSGFNKVVKNANDASNNISKSFNKGLGGMSKELTNQIKAMKNSINTATKVGKDVGNAIVKGMQNALTNVSAIGKVMFKSLSGLASSFMSIGRTFGTALSSGLRMCTGIMRTVGKGLSTAVATGFRAGFTLVKAAANGLASTIKVSLNGVYQVATSLGSKIGNVISKAINQESKIKIDAEIGGGHTSKAYSKMTGFENRFVSALNATLSSIKATLPVQIGSVFESVSMGLANKFSKLGNAVLLASQAFTLFKQFKPQIMGGLASIMNTVKPYITSTFNLVSTYLKMQLAPFRGAFEEVAVKARAAGQSLVDMGHNVVTGLSGAVQIITSSWEAFTGSLNIVKSKFASLQPVLDSFKESFRSSIGSLESIFSDMFSPLKAYIEEAAQTATGPLKDALESLAAFMNGDFKGGFEHALKAIRDGVPAMLKYVETNFTQTFQFIGEVVKGFAQLLGPAVQALRPWAAAINGLLGILKPFVPTLTQFCILIGKCVEVLGAWVNEAVKWIGKFSEPIKKFADGCTSALKKLTDWVDGKVDVNKTPKDQTRKTTWGQIDKDTGGITARNAGNNQFDKKLAELNSAMKIMEGQQTSLNPLKWRNWDAYAAEFKTLQNQARATSLYKDLSIQQNHLDRAKKAGNQVDINRAESKIKYLQSKVEELGISAESLGLDFDISPAMGDINNVSKNLKDSVNNVDKEVSELLNKLEGATASTGLDLEGLDIKGLNLDGFKLEIPKFDTSSIEKAKEELENALKIEDTGVEEIKQEFEKVSGSIEEATQDQTKLNNVVEETANKTKKLSQNMRNFAQFDDEISLDIDVDSNGNESKLFSNIRKAAEQATESIRKNLNKVKTDVPEAEMKQLRAEFERAKKQFKQTFNINSNSTGFGKTISKYMTLIGKYSNALAKIKNPLLTIRTNNVEKKLSKLQSSIDKTKAAYDRFRQASNKVATLKVDKNATAIDKLKARLNQAAKAAGLLKSALGTKMRFDAWTKAADKLKNVGKDIEKLKSRVENLKNKIGSLFTSMFNKAANTAKSGWNKIASIFKKGASDAKSPVAGLASGLKSLIGKAVAALGLYQLGSIFKEGTAGAIKFEAGMANIQRMLGEASQSLIDFANTSAVSFGISKQQVAEYGNIFSVITSQFANTEQEVANLSQGLLECGGVIANSLGMNVQDVLESLRSGILGSAEAVDQLGLNLKISNLEMSESFKIIGQGAESWNDLSAAQQQAIITQEILNQTQAIYGELALNSASAQNVFKAQLENTKMALGNVGKVLWMSVLPYFTQFLAIVEKAANALADFLAKLLGVDMSVKTTSKTAGGLKDATSGISNNADKINDALGGAGDALGAAKDAADGVKDSLEGAKDAAGGIGDDAKDSVEKAEEAVEEIKKSLAGFDQINLLSLPEDEKKEEDEGGGKDPSDGGGTKDPEGGEKPPYDPSKVKIPTLDVPKFEIPSELEGLTETTVDIDTSKFEEAFEKLKKILDEILEPIKEAWAAVKDKWMAAWEELKDAFKNFCDALGDLLVSIWEHGGRELLKNLTQLVLELGVAIMEMTATTLNALADLFRYLDPETNKYTQGLIDQANETVKALISLVDYIPDFYQSLVDNGGQEVLNKFADSCSAFLTMILQFVETGAETLEHILRRLDPAQNSITRGWLQSWADLFAAIADLWIGFGELVDSIMEEGGAEIATRIIEVCLQAETAVNKMREGVVKILTELFKHMDPKNNEHVQGLLDTLLSVGSKSKDLMDSVIREIEELFERPQWQNIVNNLADILAILGDLAAFLVGECIDVVKAFVDSWIFDAIIDAIGTLLEWVTDLALKLEDAVDIAKDCCSDIKDFLVAIFEGDGEAAGQALASFIKNAFALAWEIARVLVVELGGDLVKGLIEGICALPGLLWDAVTFLFDMIVGFFKELFGIHSPSTVMADLGVNLIEGLIQGIKDMINAVGDAISAVCDAIKEFFSKGWEKVKEVFSGVGEFFSGVWSKITDAFKDTASWFGETFSDGWNGVKDAWADSKTKSFFDKSWTTIKTAFKDTTNWFGKTFSDGWNSAKDAWKDAKSGFSTIWGNIKDAFKDTTSWFGELFSKGFEAAKNGWKDAKSAFGTIWEGIKSAFNAAETWFGDTFESCCTATKKAWESAVPFFETVWTGISDAFKGAADFIGGAFETAWSAVEDAWKGATKWFQDIWTDVTNVYKGADTWFRDKFDKAWNYVEGAWKGSSKWFQDIWDDIEGSFKGADTWFRDKFDKAWNYVEGAWKGATNYFQDIWDDLDEKSSNMLDAVCNSFDTAWKDINNAWSGATKYFQDIWNDLQEKSSELLDDMRNNFKDAWDKITNTDMWGNAIDFFTDIWDDMQEKSSDLLDDMRENFGDAWDTITNSDMWGNAIDFFTDIWDDMKEKSNELLDNMETKFKETWDNVSTEWDKSKQWFKDNWDNISDSCTKFLEDTLDGFTNTWKDVSDAWDESKEWFKENWENIMDSCTDFLGDMLDGFKDTWEDVSDVWEESKEWFSKVWSNIKESCDKLGENIGKAFETSYKNVNTTWDKSKKYFQDKWNDIKNAFNNGNPSSWFTDVFTKAKDAMTKPFNTAKTEIGKIFDNIKSDVKTKFNNIKSSLESMTWKLPKLKLPHIKITGSLSLNPPSVPKLSIEWYKKGGIMTNPTLFGFNGPSAMVGGEAGAEAILPLEVLWQELEEQFDNQTVRIAALIKSAAKLGANGSTLPETNFTVNIEGLNALLEESWLGIIDVWYQAKNFFNGVWDSIGAGCEEVCGIMYRNFEYIFNALEFFYIRPKLVFEETATHIAAAVKEISDDMHESLSVSFDTIMDTWSETGHFFEELMRAVMDLFKAEFTVPTIEIFAETLDEVIDVWNEMPNLFGRILTVSKVLFENFLTVLRESLIEGYNETEGIWNELPDFVGDLLEDINDTLSDFGDDDVDLFEDIFNAITDMADDTIRGFSSAFRDCSSQVKDEAREIVDYIKAILDFEWKLPKIKLPHFEITGEFSMDPASAPEFSVDWHAVGGVFQKPTVLNSASGLHGFGEAGAEAILPLDKLWNEMDRRFEKQNQQLANMIASSNNNNNTPINLDATLVVDGTKLGKACIKNINKVQNSAGRILLDI